MSTSETRARKPSRTKTTDALKKIAEWFIKPLGRQLTFADDTNALEETIAHFFHRDTRIVVFVRATQDFKLPGRVEGARKSEKRVVLKGDPLIVRTDITMPDRNEVVFNEQLFVLTGAQFDVVKDRWELVL